MDKLRQAVGRRRPFRQFGFPMKSGCEDAILLLQKQILASAEENKAGGLEPRAAKPIPLNKTLAVLV